MSQKSAIEKQPIIAKAAIHEGDTGSPEVQVALLAAAVTCWPICRRRTSTVTVL